MKTDAPNIIIRAITALVILSAFLLAESVAVAQVTRAKTTEELIAEVEAADRNKASASASLENEPKSAAEILAEIEALSTPTNAGASEEDDDESDKDESDEDEDVVETGSSAVELPVDSEPLPDEVIGEYAVDEDGEEGLDIEVIPEGDTTEIASTAAPVSTDTASETLYEKADALEPQLMLAGTPAEKDGESQVSEKISGRIVAEKQPVARRRHINRWVLKTEDGRRIPLKSNIKLLQEVRRENILDSEVSLTGRYVRSGMNDNLRYFVVESAVVLEDEPSEDKTARKDKK